MPEIEWSRDLAAHLLRRAGFGATLDERERYFQMGLNRAVDTLVDYELVSNAALEALLEEQEFDFTRTRDIQDWWLLRMLYTERPLEEKMVLFWHNHFATSVAKVDKVYMKWQNDLFRSFALGNFRDFLVAVSKDPAMLDWLDNRTNRVGRPNENYARELMELFTTGIGHYTESDVQEVARCFTGWTIRSDAYFFASGAHDTQAKTVLGTFIDAGGGESDGVKVCDLLAAHPETPRFLINKIFKFFVYENPSQRVVDRYADVYARNNYSIREVMRAILKSKDFYSEKALFGLVKSPVEFAIGALRQLHADVYIKRLAEDIGRIGQTILAPPDVSGWDGGLAWINTSTALTRANFANDLVSDRDGRRGSTIDPTTLLLGRAFKKPNQLVNYVLDLLGPISVGGPQKKALKNYLLTDDQGIKQPFVLDEATVDEKVRGLLHLVMALPEFQLN